MCDTSILVFESWNVFGDNINCLANIFLLNSLCEIILLSENQFSVVLVNNTWRYYIRPEYTWLLLDWSCQWEAESFINCLWVDDLGRLLLLGLPFLVNSFIRLNTHLPFLLSLVQPLLWDRNGNKRGSCSVHFL